MVLADVTVPYGDWVSTAVGVVQPVVTLALTGLVTYVTAAYVPGWLSALTGGAIQSRLNEVLAKAVDSAIARTQGAMAGQVITIPVASEILGKAIQYAITLAPQLIKKATEGSLDNLMNMVLARMKAAGIPTPNSDEVKAGAEEHFDFKQATDALGGSQPPAPKAPPPKPKPTLQQGNSGAAVKELQQKLGITPDGVFGPGTEQAVKSFQSAHGLTPDGVVGPSTWKALG